MTFLNNFYTVFVQVFILFIFMGLGFVGEKKKFITQEGSKVISDIILYFVTPCLIINSLNIKFDTNKLKGLIICFVAFSLIQVFSIVLSTLLFKKAKQSSYQILRFAVVFSNVGYMGISLQTVNAEMSAYLNIPVGIIVMEVEKGSPAEKAGLLPHDIITNFDGDKISDYEDLQASLQYCAPGTVVDMIVMRQVKGEYTAVELEITLGERPE